MSSRNIAHLPYTTTFGEIHQVKFKKVKAANHSKATLACESEKTINRIDHQHLH